MYILKSCHHTNKHNFVVRHQTADTLEEVWRLQITLLKNVLTQILGQHNLDGIPMSYSKARERERSAKMVTYLHDILQTTIKALNDGDYGNELAFEMSIEDSVIDSLT